MSKNSIRKAIEHCFTLLKQCSIAFYKLKGKINIIKYYRRSRCIQMKRQNEKNKNIEPENVGAVHTHTHTHIYFK